MKVGKSRRIDEAPKSAWNRYVVDVEGFQGATEDMHAALTQVFGREFDGGGYEVQSTEPMGVTADAADRLFVISPKEFEELGTYPGLTVGSHPPAERRLENRIYVTGGQLKRMIKEMLQR